MILLKGCLEENPFSGSLDPQPYEKKFKELTQWFEDNELESATAAKKVARLQKEEEEREGAEISEEEVSRSYPKKSLLSLPHAIRHTPF